MPAPSKPLGDAAADDDLGGARAGTCGPSTSFTCGRSASPCGVTPRITTFDGLSQPRFGRLMSTTVSFETSVAVLADRDLGQALDERGLVAIDAALDLGLRRRAG